MALARRAGMKTLLAALLLTAATAASAFATDLVNYDGKAHTVTLVEGSVTQTVKVGAGGALYGLCSSGPCTFKLGDSSVTVEKNDRVVIEGGALKKK
jgi:hypothetical protein